jgi:hypothetical protein
MNDVHVLKLPPAFTAEGEGGEKGQEEDDDNDNDNNNDDNNDNEEEESKKWKEKGGEGARNHVKRESHHGKRRSQAREQSAPRPNSRQDWCWEWKEPAVNGQAPEARWGHTSVEMERPVSMKGIVCIFGTTCC